MFDKDKLMEILKQWENENVKLKRIGGIEELFGELEVFIEEVLQGQGITDESAIYHLNRSGWMQKHDRAMSFDSLTAVVNNLMKNGDKSISVNVYPWKEDNDG